MVHKICNTLIGIILALIIALLAVLGIPLVQGNQILTVLSGSMEPTYPVGSLVVVRPAIPSDIMAGDVITFRIGGDGTMVTHRVLESDPEQQIFVTKGDNNPVPDLEPISYDRLVGKVLYGIPKLGFLAMKIRTKQGVVFSIGLIVFMLILFIIPEVVDRFQEDDAAERKEMALSKANTKPPRSISSKKQSGPSDLFDWEEERSPLPTNLGKGRSSRSSAGTSKRRKTLAGKSAHPPKGNSVPRRAVDFDEFDFSPQDAYIPEVQEFGMDLGLSTEKNKQEAPSSEKKAPSPVSVETKTPSFQFVEEPDRVEQKKVELQSQPFEQAISFEAPPATEQPGTPTPKVEKDEPLQFSPSSPPKVMGNASTLRPQRRAQPIPTTPVEVEQEDDDSPFANLPPFNPNV